MRILHGYRNLLAGGAISETVIGLANAQVDLGHEVLVVSRRHETSGDHDSVSERLRAGLHAWRSTRSINIGKLPMSLIPAGSMQAIREYEADVVHIHGGIFLEDAIIRSLSLGRPVVLTPHGGFYPQLLKRKMRAYIALLKPVHFDRIAAIHALSPSEAAVLSHAFPRRSIYVVPNGLPQAFGAVPRPPRRSEGDVDSVRLVYVGRLDVHTKGLDILLEAFARAAAQSARRLDLVLIGPGWGSRAHPDVIDLADKLHITDHVRVTGPQTSDAVVESLRAADVFIQTSRWDAFSLAAIEAMALELPCILSSHIGVASYPNVSSLPHIHVTPLDIESVCDAIRRVTNSLPLERDAARRCAPAIREYFSWERAAREHEREYVRVRTELRYGQR
jgi:glycosyltransferase involved in cell wall biosynthesis